MRRTAVIHIPLQLFPLGRLLVTPRAQAILSSTKESPWTYLFAHGSGSWIAEDCREQFEEAIANGEEIVSFHTVRNGTDIAVVTKNGHEETVVMLGEEVGWRLTHP